MDQVNLPDNLIRLRHEKNITQEQLADFLGVTKASVSKWENRQSMPDILLLPRLAVFFGVSIDQLMGYEPQLSKEQIQKIYQDLSEEFAVGSFEDTMDKSREQVRNYYSCYPFLLQMCVLWLNHFMLPQQEEQRRGILEEIEELCNHIICDCSAVNICNDAISVKAIADLQLGKAKEVAQALAELTDPMRISSQNDILLAQAYQVLGDTQKARSYTQITIYSHLMALIACSIQYLAVNLSQWEQSLETIQRTESLLQAYRVESLHPNVAAQFYYQSALAYASKNMRKEALKELQKYAHNVRTLTEQEEVKLHGDSYFDCLDNWIDQLDLGAAPPRSPKWIIENFQESLKHSLLACLWDSEEFQKIRKNLSEDERRNQK